MGAFSLVELIVVMAVISVMLALGATVGGGLFRSNTFSGNVAKVSGILEQARQYAIANNTYVWVSFTNVAAANASENDRVAVAVVASVDGSKSVGWGGSADVSLPTAGVTLVNRVVWLDDTKLDSTASSADLPSGNAPSTNGENLAKDTRFTVPVQGQAGGLIFDRVALFTPRGEATVEAGPVAFADIALRPAIQNASSPSKIAFIQLSGPTGSQRVYR